MKLVKAVMLLALGVWIPSVTFAQKSTETATNGTEISIISDDFANRYEYNAPVIRFGSPGTDNGVVIAGRIKSAGKLGGVIVSGVIMYDDDWRRYSQAIFRGGDEAQFKEINRKVVSCRVKPCTLSETFVIDLTKEEIAKYGSEGKLEIQVRGTSSDTFLIEVPTSYINALVEVTERQ